MIAAGSVFPRRSSQSGIFCVPLKASLFHHNTISHTDKNIAAHNRNGFNKHIFSDLGSCHTVSYPFAAVSAHFQLQFSLASSSAYHIFYFLLCQWVSGINSAKLPQARYSYPACGNFYFSFIFYINLLYLMLQHSCTGHPQRMFCRDLRLFCFCIY